MTESKQNSNNNPQTTGVPSSTTQAIKIAPEAIKKALLQLKGLCLELQNTELSFREPVRKQLEPNKDQNDINKTLQQQIIDKNLANKPKVQYFLEPAWQILNTQTTIKQHDSHQT